MIGQLKSVNWLNKYFLSKLFYLSMKYKTALTSFKTFIVMPGIFTFITVFCLFDNLFDHKSIWHKKKLIQIFHFIIQKQWWWNIQSDWIMMKSVRVWNNFARNNAFCDTHYSFIQAYQIKKYHFYKTSIKLSA